MKKTIITSIIALNSLLITAQKINFGVRAGFNSVNVSTNVPVVHDHQKNVSAFNAGVFADVRICKKISLQPQLLYNGKGVFFDAGDHTHTLHLQSLDLPVYAMYRTESGFFVSAGPNFGYYLSGTNVAKSATMNETHDYKFTNTPFEYKRFDFGITTMVGFELKNGLSISANYLKGLNNVSVTPGFNWKSNVLAVSVGYKFKKKTNQSK